MLNNFAKTALQTIRRKKSFSIINIMGLAVGIAASLLIFLIIRNELSFDRYHHHTDRIYRITGTKKLLSNGEVTKYESTVPILFPQTLQLEFPQLEQVGAVSNFGEAQVYVAGKTPTDEKKFKENNGLAFVNPGVFSIFDFHWVAGNAKRLNDPNMAVLTESLASLYFGEPEKAIGQTIQLWSFRIPFQIVGVYKDIPANTDVPLRIGFSFNTLRKILAADFTSTEPWYYTNNTLQCFVLAPKDQSIHSIEAQLPSFVKKYYGLQSDATLSLPNLHFQPLHEMHLDKRYSTFRGDGLSVKQLWSLALIGLFLLLVACINFVNLATAQSVTRAKEIGVRKVLGSNRRQIMQQFLYETGFITLFAVMVGYLLALLAIPFLSDLLKKPLSLHLLNYPSVILFLSGTILVVTLLAGSYPALVLSGFNPITIFRSKMNVKLAGGISLRKGLVVFQFVIAQLLIIGTIVVVKQMHFFRTRPMGFDRDGTTIINLPSDSSLKVKYPLLKSSLAQVPGVLSTSLCMAPPSNWGEYATPFYFNNKANKEEFNISWQFADTGYFKTFGLQLVTGRIPFQSDSIREYVVNETLVKKLGYTSPGEIIGKTISDDGIHKRPIVGVVRDFNSRPLRNALSPLAISTNQNGYEWIAVRINSQNMQGSLAQVQKVFTQIYPTYLFDQYFVDDIVERFYKTEAMTAQLFKIFAFLAIFISCLGLYGLVSFMAVQKTKEVGIRKVLGASVQHIVLLFSKEFTLLICLAFLIAAPVGYYFMQQWLSDFYYHIPLGWSVFAIAIVGSVTMALITVGYKAVKAALANPVTSLKTE